MAIFMSKVEVAFEPMFFVEGFDEIGVALAAAFPFLGEWRVFLQFEGRGDEIGRANVIVEGWRGQSRDGVVVVYESIQLDELIRVFRQANAADSRGS